MVRTLSASGPRELPLLDIDEADDNGYISLQNLRQGLTVRMPAFSGTPGTRLNVVLNSAAALIGRQVVIEDPEAEIVVHISPSDALRLVDQTLVELYAIYHGDPIEISPSSRFSTGSDIYAPIIDEAVDGVISPIVEQATVRIRAYEDMTEGDRIELYIFGSAENSGRRVTLGVEPGDVGSDITFVLSVQRYWATTLYLTYEVHQDGRVLAPRASTFVVHGPLALPPPRPVYLIRESEQHPNYVSTTYEGEEHCLPFEVSIPINARPGDRVTLFAIPRYGKAVLDHHRVDGTENGEVKMCLTLERVMEWPDQLWQIGHLVEILGESGDTMSSAVIPCGFIVGGGVRTP